MEHDRFDDVEVRFLEQPEPRPRRGRWAAAAVAVALAAGGLAAAASAGGAPDGGQPAPPAAESRGLSYPEAGVPHMRKGKPCRRGERYRDRAAYELRH